MHTRVRVSILSRRGLCVLRAGQCVWVPNECVCSRAASPEPTAAAALKVWTGCAVCLAEFRTSAQAAGIRAAQRHNIQGGNAAHGLLFPSVFLNITNSPNR